MQRNIEKITKRTPQTKDDSHVDIPNMVVQGFISVFPRGRCPASMGRALGLMYVKSGIT